MLKKLTLLPLAIVLLSPLLNGCSMISYYSQSVQGQLTILYNREDIDEVLADPNTDKGLKHKLQQVKHIRHYASDTLLLPKNKSYLYYTDLQRPYVVWNVFAAPEFSLTPKKWCYLIIGCVSYRGYFDEKNALNHAQQLRSEQYDTHVAGISAYSTLGWFNDPLLNTMIGWHERALAGLIFHELSHQVLYFSNETGFNEAFASSVERIGSIQWLLEHKPEQLNHYLSYLEAQNDFRNLLVNTREKLILLYDSNIPDESKRTGKQRVFDAMHADYKHIKQTWPDNIHFDNWFNKPINNARFSSSMTYLHLIPAFYTLFLESGGDWNIFYESIKKMEDLEKSDRDKLIKSKVDNNFNLNNIVALLNKQKKNANKQRQSETIKRNKIVIQLSKDGAI